MPSTKGTSLGMRFILPLKDYGLVPSSMQATLPDAGRPPGNFNTFSDIAE